MSGPEPWRVAAAGFVALAFALAPNGSTLAQGSRSNFGEYRAVPTRDARLRDHVEREDLPPLDNFAAELRPAPLERIEPPPTPPRDASALPADIWRGMDVGMVEGLISRVDLPPRSPAVAALWRRLLRADAPPPGGADSATRFAATRAEALYRSGLVAESGAAMGEATDPLAIVLRARADLALGDADKACPALRGAARDLKAIPPTVKQDVILGLGYCALAAHDRDAAGIAAALAREHGLADSPGLAALDAMAVGARPKTPPEKPVSAIDYRLLRISGADNVEDIAAKATPSLLAVLIKDRSLDPLVVLTAAEAAARLNIISANELADIYSVSIERAAGDPNRVLAMRQEKALRRAALFVAAERERDPMRKAQAIRAYIDEARASGSYMVALGTAAAPMDAMAPAPEFAWFAETAAEISLAAGRPDRVVAWVDSGPSGSRLDGLEHWLALVDIADPDAPSRRGANLAVVEELALRGLFSPEALHRLATVLAALDYDVPGGIWDAASGTPQPDGGYLPAADVLSDLVDAAKKREVGRVVLLVLATLGPNGPEGAHVIALGDAIRGLMRAGLGMEAHKLGLEALLAFWPRSLARSSRDVDERRP